jgi:hypothetical protein
VTLLWPLLIGTEAAMLMYWLIAGAVCLGLLSLPQEAMYSGYGTALVEAWNWSFMPLDILFASIGLLATTRLLSPYWRGRAQDVALALMFCAGLMALAFWTMTATYDLSWWLANLWLMVLTTVGFFAKKPEKKQVIS